ncbi:very short patch repair endonuclease [Phascolarctobacterium faecium]|uniref:very short patch repair endonuclease n=1 Tax=Phascolarctobacterium faecium TaxID=33025 RepID=UPI00266F4C48|nr:DNA mismatch endonuclease Vsr [Phascolarctobacterium faecium]
MTDNHTPQVRSYNMSKIHSKNTKPEVLVRKYLFSKGLRFRKNDKRYCGHPDIVLPKYKAIVFVNGCFWHMHEGCTKFVLPKSNIDYWLPKLQKNKEKDKINILKLQADKWRIFVVWECQLHKSCIDDTLKTLYNNIISVAKY